MISRTNQVSYRQLKKAEFTFQLKKLKIKNEKLPGPDAEKDGLPGSS